MTFKPASIIIGLGERDENVLEGVEHLAMMGCVATIRALRTNGLNHNSLNSILGEIKPVDEDRLLNLAITQ